MDVDHGKGVTYVCCLLETFDCFACGQHAMTYSHGRLCEISIRLVMFVVSTAKEARKAETRK